MSAEQKLPCERGAIQLAERERAHGATIVGTAFAGISEFAANRDRPMRILLVVLLLAFAGLLAVDLEPAATSPATVATPARVTVPKPAPRSVDVAFVRDGWVVRVQRVVPKGGSAAEVALRELTQGPTKAERRTGIRSALPERARLRSLRSSAETWFASFSRSTFATGSAETKRMRIWQIAATLAPHGRKAQAVLAERGAS